MYVGTTTLVFWWSVLDPFFRTQNHTIAGQTDLLNHQCYSLMLIITPIVITDHGSLMACFTELNMTTLPHTLSLAANKASHISPCQAIFSFSWFISMSSCSRHNRNTADESQSSNNVSVIFWHQYVPGNEWRSGYCLTPDVQLSCSIMARTREQVTVDEMMSAL
jgi:hypothetical protein